MTMLSHDGRSLRCFSIVDSGADYCAFPLAFARLLGIDTLKAAKALTAGVGGQRQTYFADIQIDFHVAEFPAYAGFTDGLDHLGFGLLGQRDFFERYRVEFDRQGAKFEIHVPEPPPASQHS
jgi:hypothetical protein